MRESVRWRGWALEATWHAERLQALGVLYALLPVLRRTADVRAAVERHLAPCGCNLWTAPALLGAVARLESEGRGEEAAALRDRLAGPLSGVGDVHVWTAVRPMSVVLLLLGTLAGHPWLGLVVAVLSHDAIMLVERHRRFARGWALGAGLESQFPAVRPDPRVGQTLHWVLAAVAGALALWGTMRGGTGSFLMPGALLLSYYAARRQWSPGMTFWLLVVLVSLLRRFSNPVGLP
jgi:hypothetical protein